MTNIASRLKPMSGRDPQENHRVASPLELFFDLSFVVAFSAAGNGLAHALAQGHFLAGVGAFCLCTFGICWAWINFTWFASAYDTDDWAFRILTMIQMAGVIILVMGIPDVFSSFENGGEINNTVVVFGYVVMRIPMVGQWLRVAKQSPEKRSTALTYVTTILISQTLWCLLVFTDYSAYMSFLIMAIPMSIEMIGPILAEKKHGGTPWHAHHIAERHGLLTIITLGETIFGTVAAMSGLVHNGSINWSFDTIVVLSAGIVLTFGMWWIYFSIRWEKLLEHHRERSFFWGYSHIVLFGSIAAVGAGLHVVQYLLEHHSSLSTFGTVLTVVIPFSIYILLIYIMYAVCMRTMDTLLVILTFVTSIILVSALVFAAQGVSIAICLALIACAPVVTVVGYETVGHKHAQGHLERLAQ